MDLQRDIGYPPNDNMYFTGDWELKRARSSYRNVTSIYRSFYEESEDEDKVGNNVRNENGKKDEMKIRRQMQQGRVRPPTTINQSVSDLLTMYEREVEHLDQEHEHERVQGNIKPAVSPPSDTVSRFLFPAANRDSPTAQPDTITATRGRGWDPVGARLDEDVARADIGREAVLTTVEGEMSLPLSVVPSRDQETGTRGRELRRATPQPTSTLTYPPRSRSLQRDTKTWRNIHTLPQPPLPTTTPSLTSSVHRHTTTTSPPATRKHVDSPHHPYDYDYEKQQQGESRSMWKEKEGESESEGKVDREGYLFFRTQHSASWKKRWVVVRGNVVGVYSSRKMTRQVAHIHLPRTLLVLPEDTAAGTPTLSPTSLPSSTSPESAQTHSFMTLAPQPHTGPRAIPFFFAAPTRLEMVLWIAAMVNAARGGGLVRTLIPIRGAVGSASGRVGVGEVVVEMEPPPMSPASESSSAETLIRTSPTLSTSQPSPHSPYVPASLSLPISPPPMTQTTASSWPSTDRPSTGRTAAAAPTHRKRFTFAQLTQRMRSVGSSGSASSGSGKVKRHTAPAWKVSTTPPHPDSTRMKKERQTYRDHYPLPTTTTATTSSSSSTYSSSPQIPIGASVAPQIVPASPSTSPKKRDGGNVTITSGSKQARPKPHTKPAKKLSPLPPIITDMWYRGR
ncbi:hypothetical protein DFJ77DRAFT_508486 [Powellomyces hirtus]|nr:hypothetical protein DFJ77DRAFT_508486 [Powellomyces hirtus]